MLKYMNLVFILILFIVLKLRHIFLVFFFVIVHCINAYKSIRVNVCEYSIVESIVDRT